MDENGLIRIGDTLIPLETVIEEYNAGATPEKIVEVFDSLKLQDVYAVIAYYLYNRHQVDAYILWIDDMKQDLKFWNEELPVSQKLSFLDMLKPFSQKPDKA